MTSWNKAYLNSYLNQGNFFMPGMCSPEYSNGAMLGSIACQTASFLLGNLLNGTFSKNSVSNFGGSYGDYSYNNSTNTSGNSSNVKTSSYTDDIENKKTQISNAKKELTGAENNLTTARNTLTNYEKLYTAYTNAKNALENATKPGASATEEEKAAYEKLENAVETALENLKEAGYDEKDKTAELKAEVDKAQTAVDNQKAEIENLEKELDELENKSASEQELETNLNKKDGSWIERKIDGKDTIKDKLNAFKLASSKFYSNPYSLSKDEVKTLLNAQTLKQALLDSDNTDSAKAIAQGLDAWTQNSKTSVLQQVTNYLNNPNSLDANTFKQLQEYGCFIKKDRTVGNKLETIYVDKYHNDNTYILDDNGNPQKITHVTNGNILHKAKYR